MKSQLFIAAETGNISMYRSGLSKGGIVDELDEIGQTPLMIACKFGHTELVKFILSRGADINIIDRNGLTAYKNAQLTNKKELISLFSNSDTITENTQTQKQFINLAENIHTAIKEAESIVKALNKEHQNEVRNDLINILLLIRNNEELNLLDGFGFGMTSLILFSDDDYKELFNTIKTFTEDKLIQLASSILESEKENIKGKNISVSNFNLESLQAFPISNADKMRKAFYEFAEVIIKADGLVTEKESNSLKFLSNSFFKTQNIETQKEQQAGLSKNELSDILEELNNLIGMDNIKQDINSLINIINVNKLRKKEGLPEQKLSLHSVFLGPPGTGKTTIARILSNIYNSLEVLPDNNFIETDRSGLVAGYVGQTAIKTDNIINQALNGVLFIDEAYALKRNNSDNDYGQEAIDILLKRMEDHRDNLIIIVAGYNDEMEYFINSNPGLKSRFNRYFHFNDYEPLQLTEIYKRLSEKSGFILKEPALKRVNELFEILYAKKDKQFGNARLARNIFEKTFEKHANRTALIAPITREILTTIEGEDIPFNEFLN